MPHITDPGEPYFKNGLWGWDPAGTLWLPVHIDPATGHLMVDPGDDFEVHQDTPADMQVGAHGWDGTAWHNLAMVWGFSDRWVEVRNATSTGAGVTVVATIAVPAGYVYVLEQWMVVHADTVARAVYVSIWGGIEGPYLYQNAALAAGALAFEPCRLTMKEGDYLTFTVTALTNTKVCYLRVWGYKMLIAE